MYSHSPTGLHLPAPARQCEENAGCSNFTPPRHRADPRHSSSTAGKLYTEARPALCHAPRPSSRASCPLGHGTRVPHNKLGSLKSTLSICVKPWARNPTLHKESDLQTLHAAPSIHKQLWWVHRSVAVQREVENSPVPLSTASPGPLMPAGDAAEHSSKHLD